MRHILDAQHRGSLGRCASLPWLLAFDFDGTLAPFTADPSQARMRPATRALFSELAHARPVAVLSGRARAELLVHLAGIPLTAVVGNHGIEPDGVEAQFVTAVSNARETLAPKLDALAGVYIEDKTYTLAIHYRHAPDRVEARAAIDEALQKMRGVRVVGGELVVNVIPREAPHKGVALLGLLDRLTLAGALYVGDDETDEDVFRLAGLPQLVTVRVGYSSTTRASHFLEHQDEVDLLLEALLER